ncbi:unnamed protein product [Zymoseptoria tritici ST99CH_1E4]|uniref:Major facilitator superfamily (MFS) profile domain-containing protein n=1 Tax=Zymoseptoria tritici ST99CH_1E4 TaxID=1276532 RepID=A0A2H1FNP5_ZYMTR|nr:unnamed protein product [Zymoseptoria tritici ST99CH_1E4]
MKLSDTDQKVISQLNANWIWTPHWIDSAEINTAGRIVHFKRQVQISSLPETAVLHFSADTRYKLYVNGARMAVGPCRSSPYIWYYDTLDIAPFLIEGQNVFEFAVIRYFASSRAAMPFERTQYPGLTICGGFVVNDLFHDLDSTKGWRCWIDDSIRFPTGLVDDGFLHISERITPAPQAPTYAPIPYGYKTLNGDILPWRLRPRSIPMPEESVANVHAVRSCQSARQISDWTAFLRGSASLTLPAKSSHRLEIQAEVHSTAFLRWTFDARQQSQIKMKVTYSEGYELEPRSYPFFRTKKDRVDASNGHLLGPFDEIILDIVPGQMNVYEPFWFRTFRLFRLEIEVGAEAVELSKFEAKQTNYPLDVKASWQDHGDPESEKIWEVSIRTMRNCMHDAYSDCPFYEQLQYSGDSRSVGLFHYLISGDDRLMRQTINNFASSIGSEGLTQSRFPSHVMQLIAGFSIYWILQVCDHHLFFGDTAYSRSFLPRIDGVLEFFASYVDERGLVSGLPADVWQYVDWVTTWGATDDHPDKGVPTSGRKSNLHTYFSLLYAYGLQKAAKLLIEVGRPAHAAEYESRAQSLQRAVRTHCYDGSFFTDSTSDVAGDDAYSQHCQVFAVLSGAAEGTERFRLLHEAFNKPMFSKCSYVMRFYALRAFSIAGDELYESMWQPTWEPWRQMLANNLTTWEEDDVRQRSDCHAWGSVPIYEYCTELAGVQPLGPGCKKVLFKPRLNLSKAIDAVVALGKDNLAKVSWSIDANGEKQRLSSASATQTEDEMTNERPFEKTVDTHIEEHVHSGPTMQMRSKADDDSVWQSMKKYKRVGVVAMSAAFAASLDGYQITLNGGIVSNKGFIRQFATPGTKIIAGKYISAWGGIQSAGQALGQIGLQFVADAFGRKVALLTLWIFLVASIFAETFATRWEHWLVAKLFSGMGVGMLQSTVPVYLSEVAPTQLRGFFINAYTFWFVVGQLFGSVALKSLRDSDPYDFRTAIYTQWAMVGTMGTIFFLLPETPWWLVQKGRSSDAAKILRKYNGHIDGYRVQETIDIMNNTIEEERHLAKRDSQEGFFSVFQGQNLIRFVIAAWPKITQQLVGLTVFNTYATYFFQYAGNKDPFLVTVILSCCQILSMMVTCSLTDTIGRRPLTIYPYGVTVLSVLSIGIIGCFDYKAQATGSLLVFFGCMATFATTGASAIGYAYAAEVPQQRLRARTAAFGLAASNCIAIMFNFCTPLMINGTNKWGVKTGFFFAGTGALAVAISWYILPELARRTPAEIDEMFEKKVTLRKFKRYVTDVQMNVEEPSKLEGT